jgi:protoporphyrinogen oxidase
MRLAAHKIAHRHVSTSSVTGRFLPGFLVPAVLDVRNDDPLKPYFPSRRLTPNPTAKRIAVLGGGVTGLTTAYNLAKAIPHAKITVFEKSSRLGGWLDSERVEVDGGDVLFEWGPRSLRPDLSGAGQATLQLVADLWLAPEVISTPKWQPAARNRFLYYPDRLTRMPSPYGNPFAAIFDAFKTVLTEPIFEGVPGSLLAETWTKQRPQNTADESVGDFLRRRFGMAVADNLASALFHGIYAGDIYKLSARTCLPKLWYLEGRDPEGNSAILEAVDLMFKRQKMVSLQDHRFVREVPGVLGLHMGGSPSQHFALSLRLPKTSMYSFSGGLGVLVARLKKALAKHKNVEIRTNTELSSLRLSMKHGQPQVFVQNGQEKHPTAFDYVVSSLRPGNMADLMQGKDKPLASTSQTFFDSVNKATTVMVVNLYYHSPSLLPDKYLGFGYLIPRSVDLDQNPERALGVIFGSATEPPNRGRDMNTVAAQVFSEEDTQTLRSRLEIFRKSRADTLDSADKAFDMGDESRRNEQLSKEDHQALDRHKQRALADVGKVIDLSIAEVETLLKLGHEPGLDTPTRTCQDSAPGTKLTVMLGGHWWDSWADSDYPDEQEGIKMAKSVLKRHLNITEEPAIAKARLQRDCIPQYPVGYRDYMANIHKKVLIDDFKGRVKVAGPWWQGAVGVNDCIRKAKEVAWAIEHEWDDRTGLEDFVGDEKWVLIDKRTGTPMLDPMCE